MSHFKKGSSKMPKTEKLNSGLRAAPLSQKVSDNSLHTFDKNSSPIEHISDINGGLSPIASPKFKKILS